MDAKPLWTPSEARIESSNLKRFMALVADRFGASTTDYTSLWNWSVAHIDQFWAGVWEFCEIKAETRGERLLADGDKMPGARFFPDAKLNFAENLLRRSDDGEALVFWGEDKVRRRMSWRELNDAVSRLQQAFRAEGLRPGDRVAAYMPNMPETIIAMLAATSLGGVFTSCSPDFGTQGVLDRFGQIEPKFLVSCDGYHYGGKTHSVIEKLAEVQRQIPSIKRTVLVPYAGTEPDLRNLRNTRLLADYVKTFDARAVEFTAVPFHHPLYILYSSGTTGAPKCIIHSVGGALLKHAKEHRLLCDIKPGDRVFWFTTCGWMMWNWLASALAAEATLLLYDGSPFHPSGNVIFDLADAEGMTWFGTSAKFIDACNKAGLEPKKTHKLTTVRAIGSTGSPLVAEGFDYVYSKIKTDLHLASVSGGTDLIGCLVGGNPIGPVWRGEIQAPCLGMAVDAFDDDGKPVRGEKGDLVCTKPFPSMPLGFWNDPDGSKYYSAYYAKYPNVWAHGDWVEITAHGGYIIYGRSDATLNPGGVRIGTAEIYRQVEQLHEVVESLVIGQDWQGDVRVVLFVRLREGMTLDDALSDRIKKQIRANTTPRHVPARILQVHDIPRTKSGKIVELAVR
ncbi:MAG: acetoacetate--CoA ligase, partial [Rhodospirillaceae bacterium]|nr:acetoacetate--CoA ligase [Rhodospirillaceae bacterium]